MRAPDYAGEPSVAPNRISGLGPEREVTAADRDLRTSGIVEDQGHRVLPDAGVAQQPPNGARKRSPLSLVQTADRDIPPG